MSAAVATPKKRTSKSSKAKKATPERKARKAPKAKPAAPVRNIPRCQAISSLIHDAGRLSDDALQQVAAAVRDHINDAMKATEEVLPPAAEPSAPAEHRDIRDMAGALAHIGELTKSARENWTPGAPADTAEGMVRGMLEDCTIDLVQGLEDSDLATVATWIKDRAKGKAVELPDNPTVAEEVEQLRNGGEVHVEVSKGMELSGEFTQDLSPILSKLRGVRIMLHTAAQEVEADNDYANPALDVLDTCLAELWTLNDKYDMRLRDTK